MCRIPPSFVAAVVILVPAFAVAHQPAAVVQSATPVRAIAFSPDGKLLVAGYGSKDQPGGIVAWDVAGRKQMWQKRSPAGVNSVKFAPDGQSLAIARWTPFAIRLDPASGEPRGELGPHAAEVRTVAFVLGGEVLATGGGDGSIRLWDVRVGTVRKELKGHPKEVSSLVPSPEGRWLISTGPDASRVWDVAAGEELKGAIPQERGITFRGIAFLGPDRFVMGDNNGMQRVTDLRAGKELLRFRNSGGFDGSAYAPALGLAAYRGIGSSRVIIADLTFRPPTAEEQARIDKLLKDFDDDSYAVREAATAAFKQIGSVSESALRQAMTDGPSPEVRMRARETRQAILDAPLRWLTGPTASLGPMTFSPDGQLFAAGAEDGTVWLWDPRSGQEIARLNVIG